MILVPRRRACLKNELATGWLAVGFEPVMITTVGVDHVAVGGGHRTRADALEQRRDTEEAWHSRVQWSTLFVPKPVRMSFWKR